MKEWTSTQTRFEEDSQEKSNYKCFFLKALKQAVATEKVLEYVYDEERKIKAASS